MMVLGQLKSNGNQRRCDARCYDATGKKCKCICGGVNHGVGKDTAISNSHNIIKDMEKEDAINFYAVPHQLTLKYTQPA